MLKSKPIVLTGTFINPNIRNILEREGFIINPVLSRNSQLLVSASTNNTNYTLIEEATAKHLPIFTEKDVLDSEVIATQQLWVDKFRPQTVTDIIGHKEQIKELTEWLSSWPQKGVAALITGPPGIGKTTTAHIIVKSLGRQLKEYNASDIRSAAGIQNILQTDSRRLTNEVIIMDEVDGMAGSDRGGIAAIAAAIRKGRCPPLICIANDRSSPKMRPLTSVCIDIRFSRPVKTVIAKKLQESLNLDIPQSQIVEMCERGGNDIRSIINYIQLLGTNAASSKDSNLRLDAFSATQKLFNERNSLTFTEAEQLVFVDYTMVPLMVQEAYLAAARTDIHAASLAADRLSLADEIDDKIHRQQAWYLLPNYVAQMVAVSRDTTGPAPFNLFPQWLGKNSTHNKNRRQLRQIATRTHESVTDLRLDAWNAINVLATQHAQNPKEFVNFLQENKLSRDDYFETLMGSSFEPVQLSTKEKSAVTREFNKRVVKKNKSLPGNLDDNDGDVDVGMDYDSEDDDADLLIF